ncbi:MAG TPA: transporter [Steroidobacteraceae bacterium]
MIRSHRGSWAAIILYVPRPHRRDSCPCDRSDYQCRACRQQWRPTDSDPISTDRPNTVNSTVVVPAGSLQVENGVTWTQRERSQVLDGTETLMRLGLVRCTEFQLLVPNYDWSFGRRAASGFENVGLAFKHQFDPLPGGFELAVAAGLEFPSGASAVSGPGYNPFISPSAHDLRSRVDPENARRQNTERYPGSILLMPLKFPRVSPSFRSAIDIHPPAAQAMDRDGQTCQGGVTLAKVFGKP